MQVRKLYQLSDTFENPDVDNRSLLNVNLCRRLVKGTFLVECQGQTIEAPWRVIGWNTSAHPARRKLIENLRPLLVEVEPTTLAHAKMLYYGYTTAPERFLGKMVEDGRVTVAEYLDFLANEIVGASI